MRLLARGRAERSLLCAAVAPAGRRRRGRRPVPRRRRSPIRFPNAPRSRRSSHCSPTGRAQDRARREIRLADFRAARHRDRVLRRHDADVVCARCRTREPCAVLARRAHLQSCRHRPQRADQARQDQDHFRCGRDRARRRICRREGRYRLAALARAQAAACRRARAHGLRDAGAAARRRAGAHGAPRHFHRPQRAVAAVGRIRPGSGGARSRDQQASRRDGQSRQPEAARRHPVRQARACRAAPRPRPGNGRPARARSKSSPSRATSCRRRSSTGGRCRS